MNEGAIKKKKRNKLANKIKKKKHSSTKFKGTIYIFIITHKIFKIFYQIYLVHVCMCMGLCMPYGG